MHSDENIEKMDRILKLLSKPLTRYLLAILAGVDPGVYTETIECPESKTAKAVEEDL